jgi:YidC/Oxa1 family membrane protein insertase
MDRQAIVGFVLIAIVLIIWMSMNAPPPERREAYLQDTTMEQIRNAEEERAQEAVKSDRKDEEDLGKFFAPASAKEEKVIIIETDLYRAEITTRGGLIRKWELKEYTTWDGHPVQLIEFDKGGDFSILFTSSDGKLVDTRNLTFDTGLRNWQKIHLAKDDSASLELVALATNGGRIVKRFTFWNGRYSFGAYLRFDKMQEVIAGFEYQVVWENGLRYAEHNSVDESSFAMAYAFAGGELVEIDASHVGDPIKSSISGKTDWVSTRNKYFALAIIPAENRSEGAYLEGHAEKLPDNGIKENYNIGLRVPYRGAELSDATFTVFVGPLDFDIIKSYNANLDQMMSLGAAWIIRPISEWVMIPLLQFLRMFIPNYGIVIIVFSIIIKVVLHPLTKTSMKSMKRMQSLQPLMEEIRQKYKDDPTKMNKQVMQLYKDYGVNPLGGCLPLLLQLPILYALWTVFRSAIELRQANFVWWITDLSIPDVIVSLPAAIPLFGVKDVSGLALLMGITMFVQQKMTVKDPRQKMMVWLMPIFLTLLFNSFPSGLNLYYFVFNLLSIGQQMWINKQHGDEPLRKVDEKKKSGGIMNRITKDLPRLKR